MKESRSIMVIDNEELVRNVLRDILKVVGFDVVVIGDGEEGLERLRKNPSDLCGVITDMHIAEKINGNDIAREAGKANPPIPVALLYTPMGNPDAVKPEKGLFKLIMHKPPKPLKIINLFPRRDR